MMIEDVMMPWDCKQYLIWQRIVFKPFYVAVSLTLQWRNQLMLGRPKINLIYRKLQHVQQNTKPRRLFGGKFQLLNSCLDDFFTLPFACYGCHWQQKAEKVGIQEEAKQQLRNRGPTSQCTTLLHSGGICQGCISFQKPLILLAMFFIQELRSNTSACPDPTIV